ncbi:vacuolar aminopeptidase 1 [[Candida] railenensis]|uniref:Vacuolar aminopeptidase 1 n=1 Tax=[Candida] railenensis TaxID=45579 RepID=A0A9P0W008_9ASCO|nr:vacuolar aminopeptidase 1 [[Candida] railenensis]
MSFNEYSDFENELTTSDGEFDGEFSDLDDPPVIVQSFNSKSSYDHLADKFIDFTNQNPTTFHTISYFKTLLESQGFQSIPESKPLTPQVKNDLKLNGGLYYSVRSDLSLVAFVIGAEWKPENGVGIIGSHVDALTAKLKPISVKSDHDGYQLLGVAPYSGTLNKLWLDRDLGIGGKVIVKDQKTGRVSSRFVKSAHPIAKIPSIAEHFIDFEQQKYNKETGMVPIIGFTEKDDTSDVTDSEKASPLYGKHSIHLLRYISKLSSTPISHILQLDLELYDVQAATRGGLSNEFIFAPRVDDRLCSFAAIYSLIQVSKSVGDLTSYGGFQLVNLVDNEEIGSATRTGVRGKFMNSTIDRVLYARNLPAATSRQVYANSFILSADVTHALNPNFASAYLKDHAPLPNVGLTIKQNANWKNMTDSTGLDVMRRIAKKNKLTLQTFHIKNGEPSGGTIGPMISCDTGSRTVDVGLSQLSMHSIRAMFGYKEVGIGVETFSAFFKDWQEIYKEYDA